MATWTYVCPPCERDDHAHCQDSAKNRCDCKADNHGKPRGKKDKK